MEVKGRRETARISNWHEGMEEPIAFPVCGCGFSAQLRTSWSNDNPGMRFFGCNNYGVWCIMVVDILVGLILQ
ncbi:hypothetical protein V6N13_135369 [Hibiscus sabdariffa]